MLREAAGRRLGRDPAEALEAGAERDRRLARLLLVGGLETRRTADLEHAADHAAGDDRDADDRRAVEAGVALLARRAQRTAGRPHRDRHAVAHVRETGVGDRPQAPRARDVGACAQAPGCRDRLARRLAGRREVGAACEHGIDRRKLHHWQGIGASGIRLEPSRRMIHAVRRRAGAARRRFRLLAPIGRRPGATSAAGAP